ncbi:MAG: Ig-like domain-containing protein [Anaerolineae bacterium]|nr:Ig-like domain-containing protein [Anaerolineae bacterium]
MNSHKLSAWPLVSVGLIVFCGLALLPGATARSASTQPPLPPIEMGTTALHAVTASSDPTSVTKDADGYTVWTYEYPGSWCVMFSRIRWPFNLGVQDPTELSETTLTLTFAERPYVLDEDGNPLYTDPTWAVALNGDPGEWVDGAFTGDWNFIGAVGTVPTWPEAIPVEQEVSFDYTELIDGENNLWLQQQDFCGDSNMEDRACTCYLLTKLKLRAQVELGIAGVSPEPDTRNVWPDQRTDSEISIKFTTLVSPTSVNKETFQLYYFDQDAYKVYVDGEIKRISAVEYAFVPTVELLPGVEYVAQVWGENDAQADGRDDWVQDLSGGPLEDGQFWVFWTLPDIQVTVKPVQVLEGMALVVNKPTVLRAFIRWDAHEGVFWKSNAPTVQVEDVVLTWLPPGSAVWSQARWSDGDRWLPALTPETARHRREYREFTFKEESYSLIEKRRLLDSFNYFGFTPDDLGMYTFEFAVQVKDSRGRSHTFRGSTSVAAAAENTFPLHIRAVGVGPDYGKTGTVDLSTLIRYNLRGMRALYPVPDVLWPAAPSAMAYYTPTTTGWTVDWVAKPSWPYYSEELYLLREMHALCVRTPGCWAMVGVAHKDWLNTPGNTQRESAPTGALVRSDSNTPAKRYMIAHEVGHLAHIDEHYEGPSGTGFDVIEQSVKNAEQGYTDFMTAEPEEIGDKALWITDQHYVTIQQWIMDHYSPGVQQLARPAFAKSADPLLMVDGILTPTTDTVTLLPWYQMDAGDYVPPLSGPYQIVFLDAAEQELVNYTRAFTVNTTLRYAGETLAAAGGPAAFTFATPYPAATAKVQIRRVADSAVLAEIAPAAAPPTVTIQSPSGVWRGPQTLTWQASPGARYFAVDVSTDNGATWEAIALNLTAPAYTLETIALPNTAGALIRVAASDGLRTATAIAGPFTVDNPPLVGYVDPPGGADDVNIWSPVEAGFRDAMAPATVNSATFTLAGGPFGSVLGNVTYATATHAATFVPAVPLAYATRYTATLTTGLQGVNGQNLPVARTWTFTTAVDTAPPSPVAISPHDGAANVPRNAVPAVVWDRDLDVSTLNTGTFTLATATGAPVSGTVSYDTATRTATFAPASALVTGTLYVATLKAGIAGTGGYTTTGDFNWAFTVGRTAGSALAFTGSYADGGQDLNGDGLYEQLVIRVGVQVTATGNYALRGALVVSDSEIASVYITPALTVGVHFLNLTFDGAAIGGRAADGPYTLTGLTLARMSGTSGVLATASLRDAYRTFTYPAARFPAPLRFGGLPDVQLLPGTTFRNAFNVRDYAQPITRTSDQLSYTVMLNTQPGVSVVLQPSGEVHLSPEPSWQGRTLITIRAGDGVYAVQDTFAVVVGWPHSLYLPVVLRNNGVTAIRDAWITKFSDNFESGTIGWHRSGWTWKDGDPPPGGFGWYLWGLSECRAYSGQQSAWAYGGGDDGELLPCGAAYPDAYSLGSMMNQSVPVNLKYVAKGTYSAKVWTNLAPDDEVCLKVALLESGDCDTGAKTEYYGVCRSGATNGWEDLTLDLANVPVLGNVLGQERVCVAVISQANIGDSRPEGAYVDDVTMRFCPEGLTDLCAGPGGTAPAVEPPLMAGAIGGYPEAVGEAALAVEASGRVHALWTGKLNPNFNDYVFYSSSADGVTWTPYQILSYWGGRDPSIAVDNVHGRVHLAYANEDGIIHRSVDNGAVSGPVVVAPQRQYYLQGFSLPSGSVAWPNLAVAEETGGVYLVWEEGYYVQVNAYTYQFRHRSWYSHWAADNGSGGWSAPQRKINDQDTYYSTIVAAPDGQAMLAWFQRWGQSSGGGVGPGDPIVARTAYGTEPDDFPLRQATHALYPEPERDESILLAYAGGADAFVLVSDHLMWPGHSRAYRYVWNGAWSEPLSVAENTTGWASPVYVGAATNASLIRYVYNDAYVLKTRTETNGVLSAPQPVADYLTVRGYNGTPVAYFTDAMGGLHMVISGEKESVTGFYYVHP